MLRLTDHRRAIKQQPQTFTALRSIIRVSSCAIAAFCAGSRVFTFAFFVAPAIAFRARF